MWGHYGHSHRGFVIGFDARHAHNAGNVFGQAPEVFLSQFCSWDDDAKNAAALFLTKHEEWSHEAEHGLICRLANVQTDTGIALLRFPPDLVAEVILGYR